MVNCLCTLYPYSLSSLELRKPKHVYCHTATHHAVLRLEWENLSVLHRALTEFNLTDVGMNWNWICLNLPSSVPELSNDTVAEPK